MRYGHFQDHEYVVTRPDTPIPWINYLGNRDLHSIISNTAGGYAFYRDARLRRLTRYRYNNVPLDGGGRILYLRDDNTCAYWSPTWQPTQNTLMDYTCRHGLGYTIIASTYRQVRAECCYFIPPDENVEIWRLVLQNQRGAPASLSVFSAIEFCLWDAYEDATNFQRNLNTGEVEIEDGVIYHKTEYRERRNHFAFFACSEPLAGFDTQRDVFLGPYRGWHNPAAVERGRAFNSVARGWSPMGSHHVRLTLGPGETREIIFLLGYHENPAARKFDPPESQTIDKRTVKPVIARYLDPANVDAAFASLHAHWDSLLCALQVDTPDMHTNRMVNVWNPYQCMVTLNLARSASLFESGVGRGIGFRDSNQDLLGAVHMAPALARERILDLAATQIETGGAYHQYQPLTKRGNDAIGSNFNDDPLWLVLSVTAYLKETGDATILDEQVPYDNRPGSEEPLLAHLERSLKYTLDRLGPHGLPLIGRADWNDCLNLNCFSESPGESFQTTTNSDGRIAESILIAAMFVLAAEEFAAVAEWRGRADDAARHRLAAARMKRALLEEGWDGEWFLRAYDDRGRRVGSHECTEGRIFIEPQGMAVMAGLGLDDGRAAKALDSVQQHLATPHGILLLQPAFTRYDLNLGEITSYPPGYKENASVFCHTNPWIMIAEARLGRGDRAFDYYMRINPSARQDQSEVHRCEPYVYAQMIAGRDAPTHGEAKNSWLTGTAAWSLVAISQWILGIRPTLQGLQIAPVLPSEWDGYRATRVFRGVTYHITVSRAGEGNTVRLTVDDKPIEGNIVPLPAPGERDVKVSATLG